MYENQYEPVVTMKPKFYKYMPLVAVVIIFGCGVGYFGYQHFMGVSEQPFVRTEFQPYGLGATPAAEAMSGVIYYSAQTPKTDETDALPYSYEFDVTGDTASPGALQPQYAVNPLTATTSLVIASVTHNYSTDSWQPQIYNVETTELSLLPNEGGHHVQDLVLSPDHTMYAYSYQVIPAADSEEQIDDNWRIAIRTFGSDTVTTIPAAHGPKWLNGGSQILYIGSGGVYRYDIATEKSELVLGGARIYTKYDEVAVSSDSQSVILTIPDINLISVLHFDDPYTSKLVEDGRVFADATSYSSPVISPDGKSYAVLATKISDYKEDEGEVTFTSTNTIELRQLHASAVVKGLVIPEAPNGTIFISNWIAQ